MSHEKQLSSQWKCRVHLSNLPSHPDNATHQWISISQPCYEDKCMECLWWASVFGASQCVCIPYEFHSPQYKLILAIRHVHWLLLSNPTDVTQNKGDFPFYSAPKSYFESSYILLHKLLKRAKYSPINRRCSSPPSWTVGTQLLFRKKL